FWKMNAGMGDVVFAPAYEALRRRGVRFEFFHRVDDIVPSSDGRSIQRIDGGVQVELRDGLDVYEPLIDVKGLPCFPAEPLADQLDLGDRMPDRFDLEMVWNDWPDARSFSLEAGRDFDVAVLAIPIGMAPYICSRLIDSNPRWAAMAGSLGTVATQAVQLWLRPDMETLGWKHASITITGFTKPFDTWSSMEHLLPVEDWPQNDRPETLGYFCNTLPTGVPPPADDLDYPKDEHQRVRRHAVEFLNANVAHYWPKAVDENGFRWELLAGAGDADGTDRLDTQFWTANVDPSERYVQSLPGSDRYRMKTDQSGYLNLLLAGDWIDSGLNAGCIEAAVLSGLQAGNAALGYDRYTDLLGWYPTWSLQEAET
ncbi:MAG: FAD-dependent oxidoreductase, partial [Acidimicrobiia bacterium]|nr:FAD-dependent oxidoreductase [Acidimicrobiia bacterium]